MTTPADAAPEQEQAGPRKRRFSRPTVGQASALVGLVGGIVALVFIFKPGWKPQPTPDVAKATISDTKVVQPVTFKRYLQRQQTRDSAESVQGLPGAHAG